MVCAQSCKSNKLFARWEYCILFSDLKRLYFAAGVENKETVFLFMDTQVVEESFLEDINNILSSGEVSNLYKADEFEEVGFCFDILSLFSDCCEQTKDVFI